LLLLALTFFKFPLEYVVLQLLFLVELALDFLVDCVKLPLDSLHLFFRGSRRHAVHQLSALVHLFLKWIISTGESLNLDIDFVVLLTLSLNVVCDLDVDHAMMLLSKLLLLTPFLLHVFLPIAVESSDRSRELISQLRTHRFLLIVL
jgi:hypothetical protein